MSEHSVRGTLVPSDDLDVSHIVDDFGAVLLLESCILLSISALLSSLSRSKQSAAFPPYSQG